MISKVIGDNLGTLADIVANDIVQRVDSITQGIGSQTIKNKSRSTIAVAIGRALGKGLVNGISKIIDDMTSPRDNYRR